MLLMETFATKEMIMTHTMRLTLSEERGVNFVRLGSDPGPNSIPLAPGRGASPTPMLTKQSPQRSPPARHVPIIGRPRPNQTAQPVFGQGLQRFDSAKFTDVPKKAINKVHLGAILPDKPRIQLTGPNHTNQRLEVVAQAPRRKPVEESGLTPEILASLSIDELFDNTGIPLDDEKSTSGDDKTEQYRTAKSTDIQFDKPPDQMRENDSKTDGQLPSLMSETSSKDDHTKTLEDSEHKMKPSVLSEYEQHGETVELADDAPVEEEATIVSERLRFPPRLPPLRLKGESSNDGDHINVDASPILKGLDLNHPLKDLTKSRHGDKKISKKIPKKKIIHSETTMLEEHLSSGFNSQIKTKDSLWSNRRHNPYSFNNNANNDPNQEERKHSDSSDSHEELVQKSRESPQEWTDDSIPAESQQPCPGNLDGMLQMMIDLVSEEVPAPNATDGSTNSFSVRPMHADDLGGQPELSAASVPPGFNFLSSLAGAHAHNRIGTEPVHHGASPQVLPLGTDTDSVNYRTGNSLLTAGFIGSSAVAPPPGFLHLMKNEASREPMIKPLPGFQRQDNIVVEGGSIEAEPTSPKVLDIENDNDRRDADDRMHDGVIDDGLAMQEATADEDWSSEDSWCYEVPWPADWREKNRDASHLPPELRQQLRLDLSLLWQNDDNEFSPPRIAVDYPADSHAQGATTIIHGATERSNGNNNNKLESSKSSEKKPPSKKSRIKSSKKTANRAKGSASVELMQTKSSHEKPFGNLTSIRRACGSSECTSYLTISSDSCWSESTINWGLDVEELLLLLSEPTDSTSGFQSDDVSFASDQDTSCDDLAVGAEHGCLNKSLSTPAVTEGDIVSPFCFTLPNGEIDVVDLRPVPKDIFDYQSLSDEELLDDTLTKTDSLERYLSEGTWTEKEIDFMFKAPVTEKQDFQTAGQQNFDAMKEPALATTPEEVLDKLTYVVVQQLSENEANEFTEKNGSACTIQTTNEQSSTDKGVADDRSVRSEPNTDAGKTKSLTSDRSGVRGKRAPAGGRMQTLEPKQTCDTISQTLAFQDRFPTLEAPSDSSLPISKPHESRPHLQSPERPDVDNFQASPSEDGAPFLDNLHAPALRADKLSDMKETDEGPPQQETGTTNSESEVAVKEMPCTPSSASSDKNAWLKNAKDEKITTGGQSVLDFFDSPREEKASSSSDENAYSKNSKGEKTTTSGQSVFDFFDSPGKDKASNASDKNARSKNSKDGKITTGGQSVFDFFASPGEDKASNASSESVHALRESRETCTQSSTSCDENIFSDEDLKDEQFIQDEQHVFPLNIDTHQQKTGTSSGPDCAVGELPRSSSCNGSILPGKDLKDEHFIQDGKGVLQLETAHPVLSNDYNEVKLTVEDSAECVTANGPRRLTKDSSSRRADTEKWMHFNDKQMEQAITRERLAEGRPLKRLAPSSSTYRRIVNWLQTSDFPSTRCEENEDEQ